MEARVSAKRLTEFLNCDDQKNVNIKATKKKSNTERKTDFVLPKLYNASFDFDND
eukprot:Pgem_evm1s16280